MSTAVRRPRYVASDAYFARHDESYRDRVMNDLLQLPGPWRRLHETVGGDYWSVRDAVELMRGMGFEIEGDRRLGYRAVRLNYIPYLRRLRKSPPEIWGQLSFLEE